MTLATGRSWATTAPVLEHLGLEPEYVVCANGAITMRRDASTPGGYVREHVETFDPTAVLERIRTFLPAGKFMVELPDGFRLYTTGMVEWNLDNAREVEFADLLDQRATRVVVTSLEHGLDEFFEIVDQMGLHHVSYAIGWTAWLDIAPDGVNKATALERVRGWLDLPRRPRDRRRRRSQRPRDVLVGGRRGRSVAMGQAPDEVRAAAHEVAGVDRRRRPGDGARLAALSRAVLNFAAWRHVERDIQPASTRDTPVESGCQEGTP